MLKLPHLTRFHALKITFGIIHYAASRVETGETISRQLVVARTTFKFSNIYCNTHYTLKYWPAGAMVARKTPNLEVHGSSPW